MTVSTSLPLLGNGLRRDALTETADLGPRDNFGRRRK